eukprot:6284688-Lingulodinium_polyedra.AAC.1
MERPTAQPCGGQAIVVAGAGAGANAELSQRQLFSPPGNSATQQANLQSYGRDSQTAAALHVMKYTTI